MTETDPANERSRERAEGGRQERARQQQEQVRRSGRADESTEEVRQQAGREGAEHDKASIEPALWGSPKGGWQGERCERGKLCDPPLSNKLYKIVP